MGLIWGSEFRVYLGLRVRGLSLGFIQASEFSGLFEVEVVWLRVWAAENDLLGLGLRV